MDLVQFLESLKLVVPVLQPRFVWKSSSQDLNLPAERVYLEMQFPDEGSNPGLVVVSYLRLDVFRIVATQTVLIKSLASLVPRDLRLPLSPHFYVLL